MTIFNRIHIIYHLLALVNVLNLLKIILRSLKNYILMPTSNILELKRLL